MHTGRRALSLGRRLPCYHVMSTDHTELVLAGKTMPLERALVILVSFHLPIGSSCPLSPYPSFRLYFRTKAKQPNKKRLVSSLAEYASDVGPENFVTEPPVLLLPQTAQVCWMWSPLRTYKTTCCKLWSSSSSWTTQSPLSSLPNCSRKWQTSDRL